jgi:Zn-finger nucleic acid-binding protein
MAFVSDRARFCHYCGTGLVPELDAAADTEFLCPACQESERLVSRRRGAERVTVLECGRCAGLWMGKEAFRQLVERVQRGAVPPGTLVESPRQVAEKVGLRNLSADSGPSGRTWAYRPCAVCGELMNRRNYGRDSGIIIDVCGDHGLWFDADELARIITWLRAGGGEKRTTEELTFAQRAESLPRGRRKETVPAFSFFGSLMDFLMRAPQ